MTAREAIEAIGKEFADGINSKDAAAVGKLYTEDASLFPPGAPRQDGREAITAYWQAAIDLGLSDVVLTTVEVEDFKSTAFEVGRLIARLPAGEGSSQALTGKFIVIWKKDAAGRWCLHRDIWNFDA
jgi:uncharacterized protein (TIGR02246 family)